MRVLCVTGMYPEPKRPSFGCFVRGLCESVTAAGVEICVLKRLPNTGGAVAYLDLWQRGLRTPRTYDLVWGHYFGAGAAVALAVAQAAGRPLVITAHGSDVDTARSTVARLWRRRFLRRAAGFHLVSHALAQRARNLFGAWLCPTLIQPVGVDLSYFEPREQGRATGPVRILLVANLVPYKGWAEALGALALLGERQVELVGIGEGDGRWLVALARRLGVANRLMLHRPRPNREMPPLYHTADLLIAPSHREGFGLAPLEAMAVGVPVIASGAGGMRDYCLDGHNCLLAPAKNSSLLAARIRELLDQPQLRRRLIAGGYETAKRFDRKNSGREMAAFLRSCR